MKKEINTEHKYKPRSFFGLFMELTARSLIILVVLFVLGKNTDPELWQTIIIDIVCLWWMIRPGVDEVMDWRVNE